MFFQHMNVPLDDSTVIPKKRVDLKGHGIKCAEWSQGRDNGPNFEIFGRDLATERFYYKVFGVQILVWDVFTGSLKRFLPSRPDSVFRIRTILHITDDRLFVLYERVSCERRISMVLLDWNEKKYEFIGESRRLFQSHEIQRYSWFTWIGNVSCNVIGIKFYDISVEEENPDEIRNDTLYLWKVDDSASNFELFDTIVVPKYAQWFKMFDGKLVFMLCRHMEVPSCYGLDQLTSVVLRNENGTMVTLDDTEIHLQYLRSKRPFIGGLTNTGYYVANWHGERFFSLHSIVYHDCYESSIMTKSCLFSFSLDHRKWFEIHLNVPSFDRGFFNFSVDNGFLNILHLVQNWDHKIRVLETDVTHHRFPLGKPEELRQIAWSKFRKYKPKKAPISFAKIVLKELTTQIVSHFCSIS